MLDTLATLLETPGTLRGEKDAGKLLLIGKRLARLYARATTPRGTRLKGDEVAVGQPTVLVQFEDKEGAGMPASLDFNKRPSGVYEVGPQRRFDEPVVYQPELRQSSQHPDSPAAAERRTPMPEICAARHCSGQREARHGGPRTASVQKYLADAGRTLSRATRFGVDQTDLVRLTQTYETLCGGPELELLRAQLNAIRPQVRTRVMALVDGSNGQQPPGQQVGPEFQWRGDFEEIEYQSFSPRAGRRWTWPGLRTLPTGCARPYA